MHKFWLFVSLLLFIDCVNSVSYRKNIRGNARRGPCAIDRNNKSVTLHNLKFNCNYKQLQNIFSNLTTGPFPPTGRFKGHAVGLVQNIWNGKNIYYVGGSPPNDHGIVTNSILGVIDMFKAKIYRTYTPLDGKESFAIDYRRDLFVFFIVDYIRMVQKNLYLGIATLRTYEKVPIIYFLLEAS